MADKTDTGKRQTKKLNTEQMSVLFGARDPSAIAAVARPSRPAALGGHRGAGAAAKQRRNSPLPPSPANKRMPTMLEATSPRPTVSQPLSSPALSPEQQKKLEDAMNALAALTATKPTTKSTSTAGTVQAKQPVEPPSVEKMPKERRQEATKETPKDAPPAHEKKDARATNGKTTPHVKLPDPVEWSETLARIARSSHRLLRDFASRQQKQVNTHMLSADLAASLMEMGGRMVSDPFQMLTSHLSLMRGYVDVWQNSARRFLGETTLDDVVKPERGDRRFKDKAWDENPIFDHIKQSYLLTSRWLQDQVRDVKGLDSAVQKKLDFYTRQYVDAMSPSNFVATNPQVLRATLETGGENLVKGLENLLKDMEAGRIRMTDETAFKVGENIATTKGDVVFQNELIQLIQYAPTTPNVAQVPLLIVPPWINKYYILDLKKENSFIQWAVDQGLTVFCISWVNPDAELAKLGFEDYMDKGVLAAMEQVKKASQCNELNAIGYCLGGTLLASTLAYLHATQPERARAVRSATYFVTLVDFKDPGEIGVFIDETQLKMIEQKMFESGYFDASNMATAFNLLRANDLIWSFVVNNYLLGKEPFPFDLLYWNSDSTRMPAAMHQFYLRNMYQKNLLSKPNGITLKGVPIDLRKIKTPSYMLSAREDHITPWESTYRGTQIFSGPVTFTLSGSGHIAGVVNPPLARKYNYWSSGSIPETPQKWLETATEHEGSWWPHWRQWLNLYCGDQVPVRHVDASLEPAPGSYVKVRAV